MSQYDNRSWSVGGGGGARQPSWDQQVPPPRSASQSANQPEDPTAFGAQIEEVDRAIDNLVKSGKMFTMPGRRDSMPIMGASRGFADYDPRMGGPMMPRHHSLSEYEPLRPHPGSNLQSYYANQRFAPRPSEAEQMLQQKRRMAAQRERELRNYHQEQQYNRSLLAEMSAQGKTDRAMSPGSMNEEERRELIARQHRALYGRDGSAPAEEGNFGHDNATPRTSHAGSAAAAASGGVRGPSPLSRDHYGMAANQNQASAQKQGPLAAEGTTTGASSESTAQSTSATAGPSSGQPQQRSRANSTSSPTSNPTNFSLFDNAAQQSSRTSTSSPSGSPPRPNGKFTPGSGVAPIGTRPSQSGQGQGGNGALNKRSTTPLPSPLSYGFGAADDANANERSTSAASNPTAGTGQEQSVGLGWGNKSGVWGTKNSLGVQASVWG